MQASPCFAVLLVRLDLLKLKTGPGKKKRCREIVPHRVTGEVKAMELIPRGVPHMTGEGCERSFAFLDDFACTVFDPDSIGCEVTAIVWPSVRANGDIRTADVEPHGDVGHPFWIPLELRSVKSFTVD